MSTGSPPCIILNAPQLAQNIGAVARAMANFGLADLRLVNPRDGWPQERAWSSASGAEWPLNAARVYDSVEAAIADLHLVYATTARPRELQLPILTPREAAGNLIHEVAEGRKVGLLFGGERAGLETADIALCQAVVTLPIDPRFRSLNLAQAVIILAYEWRMTQAT
ncbi:MAG: RNA methyltransferase, partial [Phenylobacterium sp.]|nr:RNA methyltransferase [Phenylobacterium sp.]